MDKDGISIFWFRRDLRLDDNHALAEALHGDSPVVPLFIFDTEITDELEEDDPRITFIYDNLHRISKELSALSSGVLCKKGNPVFVWQQLLEDFDIQSVYTNEDYEPYAIQRDEAVKQLLENRGVSWKSVKDQVIFCKHEIMKADNTPYTVFTPYKNKWLLKFNEQDLEEFKSTKSQNFAQIQMDFPSLESFGFKRSTIQVKEYTIEEIDRYEEVRNIPSLDQTSHLSPHLRFGTVSIRKIVGQVKDNLPFLSELIWREFFMQILYHYPNVVHSNFKSQYDQIQWRNDPVEFEKWKRGETGYPMVDAGMRELNETGYMHNRVRMVVASFLCKHLLIDWRWGEAYFAEKLLDYELSSNNGNWQWAAGTGCDAAPYFRVFNPAEQVKKFDPEFTYIKKWVPELDELSYPPPIVEHKMARERAISEYKKGLERSAR